MAYTFQETSRILKVDHFFSEVPVAKRNTPSLGWIYAIALVVVALPTVGIGVYLAVRGVTWAVLAGGAAGVVLVMVTWPLARILEGWRGARKMISNA